MPTQDKKTEDADAKSQVDEVSTNGTDSQPEAAVETTGATEVPGRVHVPDRYVAQLRPRG